MFAGWLLKFNRKFVFVILNIIAIIATFASAI